MPLPYSRNLKQPSRDLRKGMTEAEQRLWPYLRGRQILGIQFYRQKPLGPYIVDFYAPAARLVIELDGSQHYEEDHARRDADRDANLSSQGLSVLRFDNLHVLQETEAVLEEILRICGERQIPPASPPPFSKVG
ncbi:MAG: endonuclease domain-containing protein [Geobacteraceae bacterium]|nr:endonuclease domain-containing protein [Geobacteraceae bacterium]